MIEIVISSPQETLFMGSAKELNVRTACGDVKILPGHAEYLAEIGNGRMRILADERLVSGTTSGGIIYNRNNRASILLFDPYEIQTQHEHI